MKAWLGRLVMLALLGLILVVPWLLRPAQVEGEARGSAGGNQRPRLVIMSPHNEQIRYELGRAFNRWRREQGQAEVELDWRSSGGTSDLRKQALDLFQQAAQRGTEDQGIGVDLFFGGGDFEHEYYLARGVTVVRDGKTLAIPVSIALEIDSADFQAAFPTPDIGGAPLYHPQRRWIGVALSSFGIIYNQDVTANLLKLPHPPQTWEDLVDARYRAWVALADPAHSGSIAATYNAILRRAGWTQGWAMMRRIFANARYFTASAGKVPVDVSAGEAAAGMCIDFYGRFQVGAIGDDRLGYVDPPGMTAITADPVSVLRGASPLAHEFVRWLLSPAAQALWQRRVGIEGGPEKFELRRLPVRRDLYRPAEMAGWSDRVDPFAIAKPVPDGMPDFYGLVADVSHAIGIDVHAELKAAWAALVDHPDHPRRLRMLELFDAMPAELSLVWPDPELASQWQAILLDPDHPRRGEVTAILKAFTTGFSTRYKGPGGKDQALRDRLAWTRFFRDNYLQVAAMARQP